MNIVFPFNNRHFARGFTKGVTKKTQTLNKPRSTVETQAFWCCGPQNARTSKVTQNLSIFVNLFYDITGFWLFVGMQSWKGSEYSSILNIWICNRFTRFCISLNMSNKCLNKLLWLWLGFEYASSKFDMVLSMPGLHRMMNMSGEALMMAQYARVSLKNTWICL